MVIAVVIMGLSLIFTDSILAQVSYGDWDKWDEFFPPTENCWKLISAAPRFVRPITKECYT